MAVTGHQGIDVLQDTTRLIFVAEMDDTQGLPLSSTTTVYLYEIQSGSPPSLKSYDFNDNTFKSTTLTSETANATACPGNNGVTTTGIYLFELDTITGFTIGGKYVIVFYNPGSSKPNKRRMFQFGSNEGNPLFTEGKAVTGTLSTTVMTTNLTDADNVHNGAWVRFLTGVNAGVPHKISAYANTNGQITFAAALPSAPSNGDRFIVIGGSL